MTFAMIILVHNNIWLLNMVSLSSFDLDALTEHIQ